MIRLALCALVVLAFGVACSDHRERPRPLPASPDAVVGPLRLYYVGPINSTQRVACADAVAAVVSEWSLVEPLPVPSVDVEVLHPAWPTDCAPGTAGCALLERSRVQVTAWHRGYEWSCASLYHELAHAAHHLRGHADPRWPTWDQRGWSLGVAWARPDLGPPQ